MNTRGAKKRGLRTEPMQILVRSGTGHAKHYVLGEDHAGFTDVVDEIVRVPQHTDRAVFTHYKGKRYVIRGGIRTDRWINLSMPLKKGERL